MRIRKLLILISATLGLAIFGTSCGPNSKRGSVVGGLIGAGAGAIIGHQSGRGLEGAAIGGAAGAAGGALLGGARDDEEAMRRAGDYRYDGRRYDDRRYYDPRYDDRGHYYDNRRY